MLCRLLFLRVASVFQLLMSYALILYVSASGCSYTNIVSLMVMLLNCQFRLLGMLLQNDGSRISTRVYKKPTDIGLLLHYRYHRYAVQRPKISDRGTKTTRWFKKNKRGQGVRPVFTSRTLEDEDRVQDTKPKLLTQQCVVYKFECGQVRLTVLGIPAVTCTTV